VQFHDAALRGSGQAANDAQRPGVRRWVRHQDGCCLTINA
jgi:hypothetical protein